MTAVRAALFPASVLLFTASISAGLAGRLVPRWERPAMALMAVLGAGGAAGIAVMVVLG